MRVGLFLMKIGLIKKKKKMINGFYMFFLIRCNYECVLLMIIVWKVFVFVEVFIIDDFYFMLLKNVMCFGNYFIFLRYLERVYMK